MRGDAVSEEAAPREARDGPPLDSRTFMAKGSKPVQLTVEQVKALMDEFGDRLDVDSKLTRLAAWTDEHVARRKQWKRGRADLLRWVRGRIAADYAELPAPPANLPTYDPKREWPWGEPRDEVRRVPADLPEWTPEFDEEDAR